MNLNQIKAIHDNPNVHHPGDVDPPVGRIRSKDYVSGFEAGVSHVMKTYSLICSENNVIITLPPDADMAGQILLSGNGITLNGGCIDGNPSK